MAPKCEITKISQKGLKSLPPKILLCISAEDQNPQNQGKPQDREAPARTVQAVAQALTSCSKAWEHVLILVESPSLPSNLVLNP